MHTPGQKMSNLFHVPSTLTGQFGRKKENWNGDIQKEKELKEQELKNNNLIEPQSPQYQSTSTTDTDDTILAPELTNILLPTTEEKQKEQTDEGGDTEQFREPFHDRL